MFGKIRDQNPARFWDRGSEFEVVTDQMSDGKIYLLRTL